MYMVEINYILNYLNWHVCFPWPILMSPKSVFYEF